MRFGCSARRLIGLIAILALPLMTWSQDSAPEKAKKAEARKALKAEKMKAAEAGKANAAKEKEGELAPAAEPNKMQLLKKTLRQMQRQVNKYATDQLFLRPDVEPVGGLVEFPAKKFLKQVDELTALAEACQKQMKERHAAAKAYMEKVGAPQVAAFTSCEEGMDHAAKLLTQLRLGAQAVSPSAAGQPAKVYLELTRLDRTITMITAEVEVCERNMKRAEILCGQVETGKFQERYKEPEKVTW